MKMPSGKNTSQSHCAAYFSAFMLLLAIPLSFSNTHNFHIPSQAIHFCVFFLWGLLAFFDSKDNMRGHVINLLQ